MTFDLIGDVPEQNVHVEAELDGREHAHPVIGVGLCCCLDLSSRLLPRVPGALVDRANLKVGEAEILPNREQQSLPRAVGITTLPGNGQQLSNVGMDQLALILGAKTTTQRVRPTPDASPPAEHPGNSQSTRTHPLERHAGQVDSVGSVWVLGEVGGRNFSDRNAMAIEALGQSDGVPFRGQITQQRIIDELPRVVQVQV